MPVLILDNYLTGPSSFYIHRDDFGPGKNEKNHSHDFTEIFLVEKGKGTHRINGKTYRLEEGMLCLVLADDEHSLESRGNMRILNMAFPSSHVELLRTRAVSLFPLKDHRIVSRLGDEARQNYISLSHALSRGKHDSLDLEIFLLEVLRLLRDGEDRIEGSNDKAGAGQPFWMREFGKILSDPEMLKLNVSEAAEQLGLSREHFSRELKGRLGRSPADMIAEARIKYACHLLRMSTLSISEIAARCGYSSPSRFYSRFREIMGDTPKYFREYRP